MRTLIIGGLVALALVASATHGIATATAGTTHACPESFRRLDVASPATSPQLMTADRTAVAWSTAAADTRRNLVTGRLMVREGDRERTIFESRTSKRNRVLGPDGRELDANYDVFCAEDWSRDGLNLLLHEVVGAWRSNAIDDLYWTWNRTRNRKQLLDLEALLRAVAVHWKNRGEPVADGEYAVEPLGWHASDPDRVVFAASTIYTMDDRFLGVWSVGLRGESPRLLAEAYKPEFVRRWGRDPATEDFKVLEVRLGATFTISTRLVSGTGYEWGVVAGDPSIVRTVGKDSRAQTPGMPGGNVGQTWKFEGVARGTTDVVLEYARPWETFALPAHTIRRRVTVR